MPITIQALAKSLDFIIDTASGDHPFDPYMSLLKTYGVFVLVGFPSQVKFSPASLNIGTLVLKHRKLICWNFQFSFVKFNSLKQWNCKYSSSVRQDQRLLPEVLQVVQKIYRR